MAEVDRPEYSCQDCRKDIDSIFLDPDDYANENKQIGARLEKHIGLEPNIHCRTCLNYYKEKAYQLFLKEGITDGS